MKPFYAIVTSASQATLPQLNRQPDAVVKAPPVENLQTALAQLREYGLQPKFQRAGGQMTATSVTLTPGPETDWTRCGQVVALLMAPAPEEAILQWLSTMAALLAKTDRNGETATLEMVAYARKLRAWPGDVVRDVLDRYPDENKWWPEWVTLRRQLAQACSERMAILSAYRQWASAPEFMAMREGLATPAQLVKRIDPPAIERAIPESLDPPAQLSAEDRDRKLKAMKAAILKGEGDE